MTKKARTILFFFCAILFFITAPSVILYSQGYRLDFDQMKVIKTGAFYARIMPKGAEIFIAQEFAKKTDFFFGSVLIENLLPKKHLIEIKKPEYQSWKKNLSIEQSRVIEAKNISLVPTKFNLNLLEKDINQFFFSPNQNKIIWENDSGLKLHGVENNTTSNIIDNVKTSNLIWFSDESKVIIKAVPGNYLLLDLNKAPVLTKQLGFLEQAKNIIWHKKDSKIIFFQKQDQHDLTLFQIDIEQGIPMSFLENVIAYQINENEIIWLGSDGFLYKNNFNEYNEQLNLLPVEIQNNAKYEIYILNSQIFLKENNLLLRLDNNLKTLKQINNNVKELGLSPDSNKIYLINDFEVRILFLNQEIKENGNQIFLTRFSENIEQVFWWTNHYLILKIGEEIKIIEIDDRDQVQVWNLDIPKSLKIYFSRKHNKLYILNNNNNLFISEL